MIKLSELPNETMLYINHGKNSDIDIMSKQDFLKSDYLLNDENIKVFTADKKIIKFNLWDILENIGEESYEGWDEDVYNTIKDNPITSDFLNLIKTTFAKHPVYYEGQIIEIDMCKGV